MSCACADCFLLLFRRRYRKELDKVAEKPSEGRFWEADHITPVCEGGGRCDLDNLRTLCIMCHAEATKQLSVRCLPIAVCLHRLLSSC